MIKKIGTGVILTIIIISSGCIFPSDTYEELVGSYIINIDATDSFMILLPASVNGEPLHIQARNLKMAMNIGGISLVVINTSCIFFKEIYDDAYQEINDQFYIEYLYALKIIGNGSTTIEIPADALYFSEYSPLVVTLSLAGTDGKHHLYSSTNLSISISGEYYYKESGKKHVGFEMEETYFERGWNQCDIYISERSIG